MLYSHRSWSHRHHTLENASLFVSSALADAVASHLVLFYWDGRGLMDSALQPAGATVHTLSTVVLEIVMGHDRSRLQIVCLVDRAFHLR